MGPASASALLSFREGRDEHGGDSRASVPAYPATCCVVSRRSVAPTLAAMVVPASGRHLGKGASPPLSPTPSTLRSPTPPPPGAPPASWHPRQPAQCGWHGLAVARLAAQEELLQPQFQSRGVEAPCGEAWQRRPDEASLRSNESRWFDESLQLDSRVSQHINIFLYNFQRASTPIKSGMTLCRSPQVPQVAGVFILLLCILWCILGVSQMLLCTDSAEPSLLGPFAKLNEGALQPI